MFGGDFSFSAITGQYIFPRSNLSKDVVKCKTLLRFLTDRWWHTSIFKTSINMKNVHNQVFFFKYATEKQLSSNLTYKIHLNIFMCPNQACCFLQTALLRKNKLLAGTYVSLSTFMPSPQEDETSCTIRIVTWDQRWGQITTPQTTETPPPFPAPSLLPFILFYFSTYLTSEREKLRALTGRLSQVRMNVRVVIIGRWRDGRGQTEEFLFEGIFSASPLFFSSTYDR